RRLRTGAGVNGRSKGGRGLTRFPAECHGFRQPKQPRIAASSQRGGSRWALELWLAEPGAHCFLSLSCFRLSARIRNVRPHCKQKLTVATLLHFRRFRPIAEKHTLALSVCRVESQCLQGVRSIKARPPHKLAANPQPFPVIGTGNAISTRLATFP